MQWGARLSSNFLNAHEITLGPTSLTWNEVLGRTMCARHYVEPHLMNGVRKYGFGPRGVEMQLDSVEPSAKRQRRGEPSSIGESYLFVPGSEVKYLDGCPSYSAPRGHLFLAMLTSISLVHHSGRLKSTDQAGTHLDNLMGPERKDVDDAVDEFVSEVKAGMIKQEPEY